MLIFISSVVENYPVFIGKIYNELSLMVALNERYLKCLTHANLTSNLNINQNQWINYLIYTRVIYL